MRTALALGVLGDRFRSFVDVTIVYPQGPVTFWDLLCGRLQEVVVRVRALPVPQHLLALGSDEQSLWQGTRQWLEELWQRKDRTIAATLSAGAAAGAAAGIACTPPDAPPLESTGA